MTSSGRGPLVLVVDDEPAMLELYRAALPKLGFEVETAVSAEKAIQRMTERLPEIVVTDLSMPGASGLTVIQSVRDRQGDKHIPVIALTGVSPDSEIWKLASEWGWDRYLQKPIEPADLAKIIRELLEKE